MVLCFLAPILFENRADNEVQPITITFPSIDKVEYHPDCKGLGATQLITFNGSNPLRAALEQIVEYSIEVEQDDWESCVREMCDEEDFKKVDGSVDYDPELVMNHIYHSLRLVEVLLGRI